MTCQNKLSKFLLKLPRKQADSLPQILVLVIGKAQIEEASDFIRNTFDETGFNIDLCTTVRLESDLKQIAQRCRCQRIDTLNHRIVLIKGLESTPSSTITRFISLSDRFINTSRFVLLLPTADCIDRRVRSRAIEIVIDFRHFVPNRTSISSRYIQKLYKKLQNKKRRDVSARFVLGCLMNMTIKENIFVVDIIRCFGRFGALNGHMWMLPIATTYSHILTQSPRNEMIVLQSFVIELQAHIQTRAPLS